MELDPPLEYSELEKPYSPAIKTTVEDRDKSKNAVARLFKRVNPTTWFDEFSNIEIKLEERDLQKP